ncbi:serine hydrolase [Nocardiopsis quinghaiensis]|uniref:serine hydrolase n=1 Tax=Nocardiopsis quinghaiensis TaxID=464995 RepID=UPI0012398374|nr:serine hydrolase [Nocardiopsis quinghaiensis]
MPIHRTASGSRDGTRTLVAVLTAALAVGTPSAAGSVTGSVAGAREPICVSESRPEAAKRLNERILRETDGREGTVAVGVSAYDGDLTCGLDPDAGFDAASVGKVVVLGALLRTAVDEGRELTAEEERLATDMITVSDNDAAGELYGRLGSERVQRFLDLAGMDQTKLHPENYVGLMRITAGDQLVLLGLLRTDNDVLGADERSYARGLMGDVVEDQRWGVSGGAPEGAEVYLKNGWLPHKGTDTWRVNSVGGFRGTPAGDYDLVVLTDDGPGMRYGVETIESVAVGVHSALAGGEGRTQRPRAWSPPPSDGSDRA